LLGAINSLNLLDGMDGLLAGFAFLLCLILGSLALLAGKEVTAYVAFTLAAALLAFLRYNFPPATIFLGDSGSMLIGSVIGVLAIDSSLTPPARMSLAAPLALFCVPILDTSAAIVRRKLTGRSIYNSDRSHLHHCLLRRLGDPRLVLIATSSYCLVLGVGVLVGRMLNREWLIYFTSFVVILSLVATRLFGYAEFKLFGRRVRALLGSLLHLPHPDKPRQIEIHLYGNVDWSGLWQRVLDWEEVLHLCRLRLDVNAPAMGEDYHAHWYSCPIVNEEDEGLWLAQIPLTIQGRSIGKLEMSGRCNGEALGEILVVLSKMVQDFEDNVSLLADGAATTRTNSHVTAVSSLRATGQKDPDLQCVRE
jgi:UDP-GlcNAc:undecaprenyl-phosphate GlcNAc-1-phosphate transferase